MRLESGKGQAAGWDNSTGSIGHLSARGRHEAFHHPATAAASRGKHKRAGIPLSLSLTQKTTKAAHLMVVVLPAPFGPNSPKHSQRLMASDRSATAICAEAAVPRRSACSSDRYHDKHMEKKLSHG
jgi:hypothetical protein